MQTRLVLVALAMGASVAAAGCIDVPIMSPIQTRTVAKEAPPGSFTATTTFKLKITFETWFDPDSASGRIDKLRRSFEDGVSKAEHEFRRDTFMTNPELADRSKPPAYVIHVDVSTIDGRGSPSATGTVHILDAKGTILEDAQITGSISRGREVEAPVLFELGYQVGVYMICRTSDKPKTCA